MRSFEAYKRKMMKNPAFKKEYDALEEEFAIAGQLIAARGRAKLTQEEVARRMGTSQSAVARLESGRSPSLSSLKRYAQATGHKVEIKLAKLGTETQGKSRSGTRT